MNRLFILFVLAGVLILSGTSGAAPIEIVDPAEILPQGTEVGKFSLNERSMRNFDSRGIFSYMDGAGEIFLEYGFERGVAAEYEGEGMHVAVEIFKMKDGDAAFGIYTMNNYTSERENKSKDKYKINEMKEEKSKNLKGDNFTFIGDLAIEFYKGQFYGRIAVDKADRTTLMIFANNMMAKIPKHLKRPNALEFLPRMDLIHGSERYISGVIGMTQVLDLGGGDLWGFKNGIEAVSGEYRLTPGVYYSLAVVVYKQPLVAQDKYKMLMNFFNDLDEYKPISLNPADVTQNLIAVKTPSGDYLGARLVSSRIEVYFHVPSPNHFRMILDKNPNVSVKYPSEEKKED